MGRLVQFLAPLALGTLAACAPQVASTPTTPVSAQEQRQPVTILVSIDGFRPDYLQRGLTPTLSALAAGGVTATMIPSFPTKTFPNHWALATGEYPDNNGIVANNFVDPRRPDEKFTMATLDPFYWDEAEPIWVTAEKAGIRSGVMFWPGSAVGWGGALVPHGYGAVTGGEWPQDWQAFSSQVTNVQRVNTVIDWLRRPAAIRPKLVSLYFDTVDTAGHGNAQSAEALASSISGIDTDIANLLAGLKSLGQPVNLVIVSDHGMAETSSARMIVLDGLVNPADYALVEAGPYASFNAIPGHEKALEAALLKPHAHMECWRKAEIPARFHYGKNPRVPAYLCLAEDGWLIAEKAPKPGTSFVGGNHGYDNRAPDMASLFVANGPAFRKDTTIPPFENVDINPLIRKLVGLPQNPALDGTLAPVEGALTQP